MFVIRMFLTTPRKGTQRLDQLSVKNTVNLSNSLCSKGSYDRRAIGARSLKAQLNMAIHVGFGSRQGVVRRHEAAVVKGAVGKEGARGLVDQCLAMISDALVAGE